MFVFFRIDISISSLLYLSRLLFRFHSTLFLHPIIIKKLNLTIQFPKKVLAINFHMNLEMEFFQLFLPLTLGEFRYLSASFLEINPFFIRTLYVSESPIQGNYTSLRYQDLSTLMSFSNCQMTSTSF